MGSYNSHETLLSVNCDATDGCYYSAKFENNYFAEGACRYAFKGKLSGNGPRNDEKCVIKVFKKEYAKNFIMWAPDLAASKKAYGFAQEFGKKLFDKFNHILEIEFLIPLIAKVETVSSLWLGWIYPIDSDERFVKVNEYVAIEPYITGEYVKFNSNTGYEENMHVFITAFCHWTWYISGHKYMVCDLQGVHSNGKYTLTDPAIHSFDQQFGPTDLGSLGMEKVLGNHICNQVCRALKLDQDNPMQGKNVQAGQKSTTYSFQVTEEVLLRKAQGRRSNYFKFLDTISE